MTVFGSVQNKQRIKFSCLIYLVFSNPLSLLFWDKFSLTHLCANYEPFSILPTSQSQATVMMLSPLLKLDIAWKAECLDGDSLWSEGKDSLRVNGEESINGFEFKLRSDMVEAWGPVWTGIGRTSFDDEAALVSTFPCPIFRFSIGFSMGTGTAAGPTVIGKADIIGNPPKLEASDGGARSNGCDCEAYLDDALLLLVPLESPWPYPWWCRRG